MFRITVALLIALNTDIATSNSFSNLMRRQSGLDAIRSIESEVLYVE